MKKLGKEGVKVGRDKVIRLMDKLGLQVKQRIIYKMTTMRKHSHSVADYIIADRGCDSEALGEQIRDKNIIPVISKKKSSKVGNDDIDWCL